MKSTIRDSLADPLPFTDDLDYVCNAVGVHWSELKNQSLLITGGTGIVGKWLLATVLHANRRFGLGVTVSVLSRDPELFCREFPFLGKDPCVHWISGDVRNLNLKGRTKCSFVIHAATDVVAAKSADDVLQTCISGTLKVLEQARCHGASRLLLLSSGAVYGKTPPGLGAIPETFMGTLDCLSAESAYAEGKRCAELLCAIENSRGQIGIPIARCFAMVGPYLPLDKHFAVGNFIGAVIRNQAVTIKGDGTPVRSYLYMADVVLRLWLLLFKGRGAVAYNVGGDESVSIETLARRVVAALGSNVEIHIENEPLHGVHANTYYPDTSLIQKEFGLGSAIGLDEAIQKTAAWYQTHSYPGFKK